MPERGEVWWGEEPDAKARPYVVLTRSSAIPRLSKVVAAPVTGRIRGLDSELRLGPDDGLRAECVASFDNLRTVYKAYLTHRLCTLGPERMAEACTALRAAVDCW